MYLCIMNLGFKTMGIIVRVGQSSDLTKQRLLKIKGKTRYFFYFLNGLVVFKQKILRLKAKTKRMSFKYFRTFFQKLIHFDVFKCHR